MNPQGYGAQLAHCVDPAPDGVATIAGHRPLFGIDHRGTTGGRQGALGRNGPQDGSTGGSP